MVILNLDCIISCEELADIAEDMSVPVEVRRYATVKQLSIQLRKNGQIESALNREKFADRLYEKIPTEWQW